MDTHFVCSGMSLHKLSWLGGPLFKVSTVAVTLPIREWLDSQSALFEALSTALKSSAVIDSVIISAAPVLKVTPATKLSIIGRS